MMRNMLLRALAVGAAVLAIPGLARAADLVVQAASCGGGGCPLGCC
jgi:hypothetical protein